MARKRTVIISEDAGRLLELEEQYRGKPEGARIRVLRLLGEDENLAIEDAATIVGYSKQAVKRWLKIYREEGIDAVLGLGRGGKRTEPGDEGLNQLKSKLMAGEFSSLGEVLEWGERRARLNLRNRSVANGRKLSGASSSVGNAKPGEYANGAIVATPQSAGRVPEDVLRFLSQLPVTLDPKEWINTLRAALQAFLGDVNHVSVSLNAQCDLLNPQRYEAASSTVVSQDIVTGKKVVAAVAEDNITRDQEHIRRLMDTLERQGFPFERYHPPLSFTYYYAEHAYLGTILLWQDRRQPVISEQTRWLMERMYGFMVFLFSDFVTRHRYAKPVDSAFSEALETMINEAGLTTQERRIVTLQTLGFTYEEMAETLNISTNTLRYHLRSIYNKTGVHSQADLFAKYFTPRFDPQ